MLRPIGAARSVVFRLCSAAAENNEALAEPRKAGR